MQCATGRRLNVTSQYITLCSTLFYNKRASLRRAAVVDARAHATKWIKWMCERRLRGHRLRSFTCEWQSGHVHTVEDVQTETENWIGHQNAINLLACAPFYLVRRGRQRIHFETSGSSDGVVCLHFQCTQGIFAHNISFDRLERFGSVRILSSSVGAHLVCVNMHAA